MMFMRSAPPAFVALLCVLAASGCGQTPVQSGEPGSSAKDARLQSQATPAPSPVGSETVGRLLMQARDAAVEGNFDAAHELIGRANAVVGKTPLEQYKIAEIRANIALREKEPLVVESAYEEMVASPAAEPETYSEYLRKLTLLTFSNRHYDKTVLYGNLWLTKNQYFDPAVAEVVANAHFLSRDYSNAESMIDRLLKAYGTGGVKLNWLQVKLACATMLRSKESVAALRKQLMDTYPQFRKQLASRP